MSSSFDPKYEKKKLKVLKYSILLLPFLFLEKTLCNTKQNFSGQKKLSEYDYKVSKVKSKKIINKMINCVLCGIFDADLRAVD